MTGQLELPAALDYQAQSSNIAPTAKAVWEQVRDSLSPARWACYAALMAQHSPLTASEIGRCRPDAGKCPWKRCSELVQMGIFEECGERECTETGHVVVTYGVVEGALPEPIHAKPGPKQPTKAEIHAALQSVAWAYMVDSRHARVMEWLERRYEP